MSALLSKGISSGWILRAVGPSVFSRANSSNAVSVTAQIQQERKKLEKLLAEELPKPYDGPERDHANFPRRKRPEHRHPVRMGFLPNEWFTFFYKKTGVTGPYLFGTGLLTFLLSKEFWVIEHEFSTGVAIFILFYVSLKKFGPSIKQYADKLVDDRENEYNKAKENSIKALQENIDEEKKSVWQAEGQKILMEAKRENIQMQLETEYRKRLMHVYEQVKKRLDYQMDMHNTRRKMEQKHMVDWIVNNVVKSITPQQEKEALQKCIDDLKILSAQGH